MFVLGEWGSRRLLVFAGGPVNFLEVRYRERVCCEKKHEYDIGGETHLKVKYLSCGRAG